MLPYMLLVKNNIRPRNQIGVCMGIRKINARMFFVNFISAMKDKMMHRYIRQICSLLL
jgi:hypothetical protein